MAPSTDPDAAYREALAWYTANWDPDRPVGQWWDLIADAGWAFPAWPEGMGGRGLASAAAKAAYKARLEVGALGGPSGLGTFLTAPTLLAYGTADQLERYMPGIVRGRDTWCQLFSEPGSGSDLAGLATRAERDGDEWVVNGQKVWNSGAQHARYGILMARTDPTAPKHRGITYFLIDMRQPGVEARPLREMTGEEAFNEVFLSDARVPDADRLGDLGDGWRVGMTTLSHERDPDNQGLGESAAFSDVDLDMPAAEYDRHQRSQAGPFAMAIAGGGQRLLEQLMADTGSNGDPLRRQDMTRLLTMRRTANWSARRAAAAAAAGGQPGPEVSTLKLVGSEIGRRTRDLGLAAQGPHGMLWGPDSVADGTFAEFAMFTPALSIAGGTDEVQRNIVGERVHGLPREPGESEQRTLPWAELPRN